MKRIYSKMKRQDRPISQREGEERKKESERCREKARVVEVE